MSSVDYIFLPLVILALVLLTITENNRDRSKYKNNNADENFFNVELFSENGTLIKNYHNVRIDHLSENIYHIYNDVINHTIDKGINQTLIKTLIKDNNAK